MSVLKTLNKVMDRESIKISDAEYKREKILIERSFVGLQISVAKEIDRIMTENHWGVNEMRRQLGVSPTTFNKLKKGTGNPTIEIISLLSKLSGKQAAIVWG
jgi:DNA-binding Xre family transcriptional regulator